MKIVIDKVVMQIFKHFKRILIGSDYEKPRGFY
jgi:hypothetical protein